MKVSIITLYGANNVGAFLQAFSLQEVVKKIVGNENTSFIHLRSGITQNDSKLKKVFYYLKQRKVRQVFFKYKTSVKYRLAYSRLCIDEQVFSVSHKYDTVIVGSDEVWNISSPNFEHHEQLFARNLTANKIIAYAPSAGNCDWNEVRSPNVDFSGFHHISVRDENAYEIVRQIDGREPAIVCDPTLLLETFDPYLKEIEKPNTERYILVYSYGLERDQITQIKKFAKLHKKKLISVGTYNVWCDENVVVHPLEFLKWLQHADLVVTSTFHGTVLSVKLHKQMAVYAGDSEKILYFLKQMEIENRNASIETNLFNVFAKQIDYDKVEEKLRQIRKISMEYLRGALESNED